MNRLSTGKRAQMVGLLVEGNSIRVTARLADVAFNTALKFVADIGQACLEYQDRTLRNLPCKRIQVDEIWSFCYAKQKNVGSAKAAPQVAGDIWTWTAICADTKLVPSWRIGDRSGETALEFLDDLQPRLSSRVQLTSDGHSSYLETVDEAFGGQVDYSQLIKLYGPAPEGERRYSPAVCIGARRKKIIGNPDPAHISTSYIERCNLTMRMSMRRFTRLTNAFSKRVENHAHSVALHFMWYNFGRIHKTLRVTPAMEAGVSDHLWTHEEVGALVDGLDKFQSKKRGSYKKENSD